MEKFKENDLRFAVDPMTRKILDERLQRSNSKNGSKQYSSVDEWLQDKDYSAFTKVGRRQLNSSSIKLSDLQRGPFPLNRLS